MNHLIPMAVCIALFVMQTLALRAVKAPKLGEKLLLNMTFALLGAVSMFAFLLISERAVSISTPTLLYGILFGILFAFTILFYNMALERGPLSYTAFYFSSSMIIPAGAGILIFGEPVGGVPLAVVLFLAAFLLLNKKGKQEKRTTGRWAFFCLLTFLCNGLLGVVQKLQQRASAGKEAAGLMAAGFLSAAVCYLLLWLVCGRACKMTERLGKITTNLPAVFLLTLGSVGGNLLLTWLTGKVNSSYLFPMVQGSIIVAATLVSAFVYKEKLGKTGWAGICTGVAAIVVLNLA